MTAVLFATPAATDPPPAEFALHRFTVSQYHELARHGVLTEDDRVELLQGWLVQRPADGPRHDATISRMTRVLLPLLPPGWMLRIQSAVTTADSEPAPDLAVVREHRDDYAVEHPGAGDIGLVIEVSESSLAKDRRLADVYAAVGVPVYWVANLVQGWIEVWDQPTPHGDYARLRVYGEQDTLPHTLAGSDHPPLCVHDLLVLRV